MDANDKILCNLALNFFIVLDAIQDEKLTCTSIMNIQDKEKLPAAIFFVSLIVRV